MTKIIACINTFQDAACVAKTADTIVRELDRVIVIDGAYWDFPSPHNYSQDGTIEVVKAIQRLHPDKIRLEVLKERRSEVEKRSRFFRVGGFEERDLAFIIDGDEFVCGDCHEGLVQAKAEAACDVFDIDVVEFDPENERIHHGLHPRLIRYHEGMRYEGNHCTIVDGSGQIYDHRNPTNRQFIPDFKLIHLPCLASALKQAQKILYSFERMKIES